MKTTTIEIRIADAVFRDLDEERLPEGLREQLGAEAIRIGFGLQRRAQATEGEARALLQQRDELAAETKDFNTRARALKAAGHLRRTI